MFPTPVKNTCSDADDHNILRLQIVSEKNFATAVQRSAAIATLASTPGEASEAIMTACSTWSTIPLYVTTLD